MSKVSLRTYFSDESSACSANNASNAIESQFEVLTQNKLSPICEDFQFSEFHGNLLNWKQPTTIPLVSVVFDNWSVCSCVIDDLIGARLDDHGGDPILVKSGLGKDEVKSCPPWVLWERANDPILARMSFAVTNLDAVHSTTLTESLLVFLVLDINSGDMWSDLTRFRVKSFRDFSSKLHVVLVGESSSSQLPTLIWNLCRSLKTPEHPPIHFYPSSAATVYKLLMDLPSKTDVHKLLQLDAIARTARAHAAILTHVKSQLPVFNKKPRQTKLAEELDELIPVVCEKFQIPISDFGSSFGAEFRTKLKEFDFANIKKMKEINYELINQLIEKDLIRLFKLVPAGDILSPSPSVIAKSIPQPNVSDYISDFNSLTPDLGTGTVASSPSLRQHLSEISSNLPSGILYSIWKLSDLNNDGGLSLKEYAIFRTLVNWVNTGGDLPKVVPVGWGGVVS